MQTRRPGLSPASIAAATMLSALFFMHVASAKDDSRIASLKAAEVARFAAQVAADGAALGQLLDDGLEYSHSSGALDSKSSFIDSLVSGKRDYVSTAPEIESVRIFGDVGVIRGKAVITLLEDGTTRVLNLGYLDVWLYKDKRWQMTSWRSARLPDAPAK